MADIDRDRHVVVERSNTGVWVAVIILILVVLALLLFLWPGWLMGVDDGDGADVINIEEEQQPQDGGDTEQDAGDTDVDVTVPEGEENGSQDTTP